MRHQCLRPLVFALASLLGCTCAWSATSRAAVTSGVPTEAIWRIQEFEFHFSAARGRYHTCESLQTKITGIMEAIGAGSVIVNIACSPNSLVERVFARIAAATPVQATPENIQAATTFDTEQQMVARLRQTPLPTPETLERFPAEWREVRITKVQGVPLGPADCDLLHDLNEQILPHLTSVRVVRKSLSCPSTGIQTSRPILVVEALMRREA